MSNNCQNCGFSLESADSDTVLFDVEEGWDHSHMACWYNYIFGQNTEKLIPEVIVEFREESEKAIRLWKNDGHVGKTLVELYVKWIKEVLPTMIKKGKEIELKQIDFNYYLNGRSTNPIHRDIENKIDLSIHLLLETKDENLPHQISILKELKKDIFKVFMKHENKT